MGELRPSRTLRTLSSDFLQRWLGKLGGDLGHELVGLVLSGQRPIFGHQQVLGIVALRRGGYSSRAHASSRLRLLCHNPGIKPGASLPITMPTITST